MPIILNGDLIGTDLDQRTGGTSVADSEGNIIPLTYDLSKEDKKDKKNI